MTGTTEFTTWGGVASRAERGVATLGAVGSGGCCTVEGDGSGGISAGEVLDVETVGAGVGEDIVFDC
jgi:hypothetical protein